MMRNQRKSFSSCTPDELDSAGLFPASGETPEAFAERIARLEQELDGISADRAFQVLIADSPEIPSALREEAENLTWEKFRFRAGWVPAWYSAARTGFLSAGILLEADGLLPLVFLHGGFIRKRRRLGYDAAETLAHEMIHAVRIPFPGSAYEEYFPCQMSRSAFRRNAGNLFRNRYLPLLFFGGLALSPVLAALGTDAWYAPLIFPMLILLREIQIRLRLARASKNLRNAGLNPLPVLLRLSDAEIFRLAHSTPEQIQETAKKSSRRKFLQKKFRGT